MANVANTLNCTQLRNLLHDDLATIVKAPVGVGVPAIDAHPEASGGGRGIHRCCLFVGSFQTTPFFCFRLALDGKKGKKERRLRDVGRRKLIVTRVLGLSSRCLLVCLLVRGTRRVSYP